MISALTFSPCSSVSDVLSEWCFNVELTKELSAEEREKLEWCLRETYEIEKLTQKSQLDTNMGPVVEVGTPCFCFAFLGFRSISAQCEHPFRTLSLSLVFELVLPFSLSPNCLSSIFFLL